jgi:hypothetical protein
VAQQLAVLEWKGASLETTQIILTGLLEDPFNVQAIQTLGDRDICENRDSGESLVSEIHLLNRRLLANGF